MKTIIGTSYFPSLSHALAYYRVQGFTKEDVKRKIDDKEITIGKPDLKPGETIFERDFRWHIESL